MRNGGVPASLRLYVVLQQENLEALPQSFLINDTQYPKLVQWIETPYQEELASEGRI